MKIEILKDWVTTIVGVLSILGTLGVFGVWLFDRVTIGQVTALLTVAAICLLVTIVLLFFWVAREKARQKELVHQLHMAAHVLRNRFQQIIQTDEKLTAEQLSYAVQEVVEELLTIVANCMTKHNDAKCAACVKLFTRMGVVNTFARDEQSRAARGNNPNGEHKVELNSDFNGIYTGVMPYFYCGNLLKEGQSYLNDRPNWRELYHCTFVVPIQLPIKGKTPKILGFLCVDASKKNSFPKDPTLDFMATVADSLYMPLAYYRRRVSELGEKGGQVEQAK